jgi:hypothetical protein
MKTKGLPLIIVVVLVIVVIIVVVFLLRNLYSRNTSDFGTWSDFSQTICLNENQGCQVPGKSTKVRYCTPNSRTGFGCIDSNEVHTFKPEKIEVSCTPACYSSTWTPNQETSCTVFDDQEGTMFSTNQNCKNPPQFTYETQTRVCATFDNTGPNACVKSDGTLASVGESETILFPCETVPNCFPGTWIACPPSNLALNENCGATAGDCGRVVMSSQAAACVVDGIETNPTNCYAPDNPGPCARWCFNYPCDSWPAGFANITNYLGFNLEIFNGVNAIEPVWNNVVINCGANPVSTIATQSSFTINTGAPHGLPAGESIVISGVSGANVGGIPVAEINGLRLIASITLTTITVAVSTSATATATGGGSSVILEQDPETFATNQLDVLGLFGPVSTTFANNGSVNRVRFKIIPSQAEVSSGAFYLVANLPFSGQVGLVSWNGSEFVIHPLPALVLSETFDDVIPRPDLFIFTEAAEPQVLQKYTLPGPVLTNLFCGMTPCITTRQCTENIAGGGDVCLP